MQTTILKCLLLCVAAVPVVQEGTPESGKNAEKPCTQGEFYQAEEQQAEEESDTLRSWDALYSFYERYGRCANASVTEGYSESIARILVDHWETLPRLAQLSADDQGFGDFVRVSNTIAMSDIATIKDNALHHCHTDLAELCRELWREANSASVRDTELQVAWHASWVFRECARWHIPGFLMLTAILGGVWFFGAGRSNTDGSTRVTTSVSLRFMVGVSQLATLGLFLTDKRHVVFIAKARPLWGTCAGIILVSGVVLISWALLWAILVHITDSSHPLDILDASESTAKAAARSSHVEDLQTNIAAIWVAGFSVVFIWLGVIARG